MDCPGAIWKGRITTISLDHLQFPIIAWKNPTRIAISYGFKLIVYRQYRTWSIENSLPAAKERFSAGPNLLVFTSLFPLRVRTIEELYAFLSQRFNQGMSLQNLSITYILHIEVTLCNLHNKPLRKVSLSSLYRQETEAKRVQQLARGHRGTKW